MSLITDTSDQKLILFQIILDLTGSLTSLTTAVQLLAVSPQISEEMRDELTKRLALTNERHENALQHCEAFIKSMSKS